MESGLTDLPLPRAPAAASTASAPDDCCAIGPVALGSAGGRGAASRPGPARPGPSSAPLSHREVSFAEGVKYCQADLFLL